MKRLIQEQVKAVLREYMEVWRTPEINSLAKQIYVDFKSASSMGDDSAMKKYTITVDGVKYQVNVQVKPHISAAATYWHKKKTIDVYLGYNVTLQDIQDNLFHEFTHRNDLTRGDLLKNDFYRRTDYNKNCLHIRGRKLKILDIINNINYRLFDRSEFNAYQSKSVGSIDSIKKYIDSLKSDIDLLANKTYKLEDKAYDAICQAPLFGKNLKYPASKRFYIKKAYEQLDKFKRKLYKNYAQYQEVRDENIDGIEQDNSIEAKSVNRITAYQQFINNNIEMIVDDIINAASTKSVKNRYDGLFTKAFNLKYDFYGEPIVIRIKTWNTRSSSCLTDKAYEVNPVTAVEVLEYALGTRHSAMKIEKSDMLQKAREKLTNALLRVNNII